MNTSNRTLVCLLVLVLGFTWNAHASSFQFTRSLQVGMTGPDVRELQKILNSDPATQISSSGVGSPGQESLYFGQLTRQAVIRFQEIYKDTILTPIGLSMGTGFVGPATIKVLNQSGKTGITTQSSTSPAPSLAQQGLVKPFPGSTYTPPTPASDSSVVSAVPTSLDPNRANIDELFRRSDAIAKKQGIPGLSIEAKNQIIKDLATTTDYTKMFIEVAQKNMPKSKLIQKNKDGSFVFGNIMDEVSLELTKFILPKTAFAQTGTDFGTPAFTALPTCTCNPTTWQLSMSPLPPTFPVLLSYTIGTQMYLNYSAISSFQLLGKYIPGEEMCQAYVGASCSIIPDEGFITPFVGSE